jgi:sialate O-acetylesterase
MKAVVLASAICLCACLARAEEKPSQPVRGEDLIVTPAQAAGLTVHNLFQSNMVLQRRKPIRIWGWSDAGDAVTVTLGEVSASATAGQDGRWEVALPPREACRDGLVLQVKGAKSELRFDDVLIGDVWVLGGQSNMEFPLAKVENGRLEIVSARYPDIRLLTIPSATDGTAKRNFPRLHEWSDWSHQHFRKGFWDTCAPETVAEMSAIGYIFGRRLHMAADVPIGLIDTSVGGTTVEAWTPPDRIRAIDDEEVRTMLAEADRTVAEWNPEQELATQITKYEARLSRLAKEGKQPPPDMVRPSQAGPGPGADRNFPGNCYLGLIAPLRGFEVKGAVFHQGYNNCFAFSKGIRIYAKVFPEMIRGWRETFHDPSLPFGIISLCTEGPAQDDDNYLEMMANVGPELREVQYRTFLDFQKAGDANVGYASSFDLRRRWYHPQLKIPAGERIARWALDTQYGIKLQWEPPRIERVEPGDGTITLTFNTAVAAVDDGSGAMKGFAIAGEDRHFQPATATYRVTGKDDRGRPIEDHKTVVLTSPLVEKPVHFRYAWGRNPLANLQLSGHTDVPVATQRSDRWDVLEVPIKSEGAPEREAMRKVREALQQDDLARRRYEARKLLEAEGK